MRFLFFCFCLLTSAFIVAQVNLGGLAKDKANEAKIKAEKKARDKTKESLEKHRKEYDESNFNYAICFLDNSGSFEAEERGNAFTSSLLNGAKLAENQEKSIEDRAYTNLKNGEMLMANNKFYLAEKSFLLAKLLYEEDGKTITGNYAQTVSNLGLLYQSRGRLNKALPYNEKALLLRKDGENKGMFLVSLNNMAVLKKESGAYIEAEAEFKKALVLASELKDKLAEALLHNNLAMTYLDMNKLKQAEDLMHSSLSEASTVLKENSSNYIKLQINLANIYRFEKKHEFAEEIYKRAIAIKDKKLGAHPDLAHLKKGLAQVYMDMGKTEEVEKLLQSAYDINKKKLGESNPATVAVQQELGNYYRFTGNINKSLDLIIKAVASKKEIFGERHPNYIQALEDLALTQWEAKRLEDSKANYRTVIDNSLNYIYTFFPSLNENEKTLYWDKMNTRLLRFYAFLYDNYRNENNQVKLFYGTIINTKGFLLNASSKIRNAIYRSEDEMLRNLYLQWLETKENLNQAYQLSKQELQEEKINMDSLLNKADELERELSKKSALFKENVQEKRLLPENIQSQLKPSECAVEIVKLNDYKNGFTGTQSFVALVIKPGSVKLVPLGSATQVDAAIATFRERVINLKSENEAYAHVWKVIDEELIGFTKVYVSLDGAYHQLSIYALRDETGKYLADKYTIQYTGNTKDIIRIKKTEMLVEKPATALLLGNPFYGKGGIVEQLPGAEVEVKNITKLLISNKVKATALYGEKATEGKLKEVHSPAILHIATHGYFLDDLSQMETSKVLGVDVAAAKENPLLRCGLLLAGCENVFDENYRPAHNNENGVLTAYEAMGMALDKTDLVVLSACETGLGRVKQGEGVYGLQRAFLIAGANSIIMSLWNVSDDATMQLMTLFYSNYAKTGNKNQAFASALKQLKTKYKEPYYWSAFILLSK